MAKKKKVKIGKVQSKRRKEKKGKKLKLADTKSVVWIIAGVMFIFVLFLIIRILLNIQDYFP